MDFNILQCTVEYGDVSNDMNADGISYDNKHMFIKKETFPEKSFQLAVSQAKIHVQETHGYAIIRMDGDIVYSLAYLDDWLTQDFIGKAQQQILNEKQIAQQRKEATQRFDSYQPLQAVNNAPAPHKSYNKKPHGHHSHHYSGGHHSHGGHHSNSHHGHSPKKSKINVKW